MVCKRCDNGEKSKCLVNDEIDKDINKWVAMEEKLENPDQMIDFQTEYTKELHDMSDYPKIDFELIRKHFKEWEHHKVEDILTYRNKSFHLLLLDQLHQFITHLGKKRWMTL